MKGRLLKGGEPDLEGVSKMVLTDWVRGKLPFFVAPPDRPEDISDPKGDLRISKKEGVKELKPVPQKLGGIIQKNKFEGDDVRLLDESEQLEGSEDDGDASELSGDGDTEDDEDANDGEDATAPTASTEVGWDDVFGAVVGLDSKPESTAESSSRPKITKRPKGMYIQVILLSHTLTQNLFIAT